MTIKQLIFDKKDKTIIKGHQWLVDQPKAKLIIITGMEEHLSRYDEFALFLNEQAISVYGLDHYGQGVNVKNEQELGIWPKGGFELTVDTFNELVLSLKEKKQPLYVFGHSLGSFVLQRYLQKYGNNIDKAILCGTNGPDPMVKIGALLAKVIVGEKGYQTKSKLFDKMAFGGYAKSIKNAKTSFDWLSYNEKNVNKYIEDPYCGYMSTGGFYKEFLSGLAKLHKKSELNKIRKDIPILLIAGNEDPVGNNGKGPLKMAHMYQDLGIKEVVLKRFDGMRHEILNENNKEEVYKVILKFLTNK
jgi:alpha-beta hydrolase superfamily lysophospholipase